MNALIFMLHNMSTVKGAICNIISLLHVGILHCMYTTAN